MNPSEEILTPKEKSFFIFILLLSTLAFTSVFAYAYVKGIQVQRTQVSVSPPQNTFSRRSISLRMRDVTKQCVRVMAGDTLQLPSGWSFNGKGGSYVWTINRLGPPNKKTGMCVPSIVAFASSSVNWHINSTGLLSVPLTTPSGIYYLHCSGHNRVRNYFFEVTH